MLYTKEELEMIEEYAENLLSINEIAILINKDPDELRQDIHHRDLPVSKAYNLGKMKTILELRKQEIQLAKLGSTVAIELTDKHILEQKINENA